MPTLPELFRELAALHSASEHTMIKIAQQIEADAAPAPVVAAPAPKKAKAPSATTSSVETFAAPATVVAEDGAALAKEFAPTPTPPAPVVAAPPAHTPTVDDVRQALGAWAKTHGGNGAALKKLSDSGHKNCSTMPESARAAFIASLV